MERAPRDLARGRGTARPSVRTCGRAASDGVRRLREDRGADADRRARAARRRHASRRSSRESPFYPEGGGQVTDAGLHRARGDRRAGRAARGATGSATTRCCLRGRGLRRGRPRARRRRRGRCGSRRWRTTPRRTSCTRRCRTSSATTSARPAPPCAPTSCASTSRTAGADAPRSERGRAARQRAGLREPAGAHVRDADRGGAERSAR